VLPAGLILPYGGTIAPTGSLMCDGAAYLISTYPRLWEAIKGSGWGQPDANSFFSPDLRERVPVGAGALSYHATVGLTDNLPLGQRGVRHHHEVSMNTDGATSGGNRVVGTDHPDDTTLYVGPTGTPVDEIGFATLNFIIVY